MKFSKQEYADLHLLYDEARGNSRATRPLYGERFPEGVLPFRSTFVELHLHLCETDFIRIRMSLRLICPDLTCVSRCDYCSMEFK
jgi:hypothetical protein